MRFLTLPCRRLGGFACGVACALAMFAAAPLPLPDRDEDGLPDVLEDRNQNGRRDGSETDWQNADTDQDGALDGEEIAAGTDPLSPRSWIPKRLAAWWWDGAADQWKLGDRGQAPLGQLAAGGSPTNGTLGGGLHVSGQPNGPLRYAVREPNGRLNVRLDHGSLRLWFRPDWTWDQRPTTSPRLFEVGNYGNTNTGWWAWVFRQHAGDPAAQWRLELAQNSGPHVTSRYWLPLHAYEWSTVYWHELTLAYHPAFTALQHNGAVHSVRVGDSPAYVGSGIDLDHLPPTRTAVEDGFALGSDTTGKYGRLAGAIDSFETFNYPLGKAELYARQQLTVRLTPHDGVARVEFVRAFGGADLTVGSGLARPWPLTLWRRLPGQDDWGAARVNGWTNEVWTDHAAEPGITYEYKARLDYAGAVGSAPLPVFRHFFAGSAMPPQHQRGHVILAVDTTLVSRLKAELAQLRTNLVGDGWTVTQIEAPRHDDSKWSVNARNLPRFASALANAARPGTTNVVFLLGHVTIPYSGTVAADGHHQEHSGAWVCDAYYGYTNQTLFADSGTFRAGQGGPANLPGDGKFDPNFLVGKMTPNDTTVGRPPDFAVGRVDFARLPVFGRVSELDLLRRYLAKDNRYRTNGIRTAGRVSVHLGNPSELFGINAAQSFAGAAFGVEPARVFNGYNLVDPVPVDLGVHFQFAGGKAGQGVVDGLTGNAHLAASFADPAQELPVTFRHVWFSYGCDWASLDAADRLRENDNWLRASLGWPNYGLATLGGPVWDFSPLGGGASLAATMTHAWASQPWVPRFQSILGDPTLRLHRVSPPANPRGGRTSAGVRLEWEPAPEADGSYFVYYSATGLAGFAGPLNPVPVTQPVFEDNSAGGGAGLYQIRTARLQVTGSGSFTNLSQGVFVEVR
jgi:hypothetical protein